MTIRDPLTPARAERIAMIAHEGQNEKYGGGPYLNHLSRVAALVNGDTNKITAWLHDVLEDTKVTEDELLAVGMADEELDVLRILTRDKARHTYAEYIGLVIGSMNPVALRVKEADLLDHLRADAPCVPESLVIRYRAALPRIQKAITLIAPTEARS